MTGTDIKAAVYNLTGDRDWAESSDSANDLILNWIQMVMEEFPPEAITSETKVLTDIVAGDIYTLPSDFAAMAYWGYYNESGVFVVKDNSKLEYRAGGVIIYPDDFDLGTLCYYPVPVVEDMYTDIAIDTMFVTCLIYFFYAQYYYQSGEGDYEEHKVADMYMGRFERMRNQKLNVFMNKTSDAEPIKTSDAMPGRGNGIVRGTDYYEFDK